MKKTKQTKPANYATKNKTFKKKKENQINDLDHEPSNSAFIRRLCE